MSEVIEMANDTYYCWDADGAYTHSEPAQPDHIAGGYLAPPDNATFDSIPAKPWPEHTWPRRVGTAWVLVPDNRDVLLWLKADGSPVRLDLGDEPDETMTTLEPKPGQVWQDDQWRYTRSDLEGWYLARINGQAEAALAALKATYPDAEVRTWDRQEAEARAYQSDSNASTPMIDALAASRGVSKADLVSRIIAKADAWVVIVGQVIGQRQALEDAMPTMTDAEIEAAVFPSTEPQQ
ncbi:hypothetical protein [Leptonema illini]|nr:hypothetical protein [Leptonema illini]